MPTHVVTFVHPNSRHPTGYGTATVEDEDPVEIVRQAVLSHPQSQNSVSDDEVRDLLSEATIYRVDGTVPVKR